MEEKSGNTWRRKQQERIEERRSAVLAFVIEHTHRCGYAPSVREIMAGTGIPSTSTANRTLRELEAEGAIQKMPGLARAIRVLPAARQRAAA